MFFHRRVSPSRTCTQVFRRGITHHVGIGSQGCTILVLPSNRYITRLPIAGSSIPIVVGAIVLILLLVRHIIAGICTGSNRLHLPPDTLITILTRQRFDSVDEITSSCSHIAISIISIRNNLYYIRRLCILMCSGSIRTSSQTAVSHFYPLLLHIYECFASYRIFGRCIRSLRCLVLELGSREIDSNALVIRIYYVLDRVVCSCIRNKLHLTGIIIRGVNICAACRSIITTFGFAMHKDFSIRQTRSGRRILQRTRVSRPTRRIECIVIPP